MSAILIAEDEVFELEYLKNTLSSLCSPQERLLTAQNGQEALELFRKEHPAVVLTDIYMPLMDGLELAECIKKESPQTVCYILTSFDYFSYAQRAIRAGVEDFVLKPISRSGLQELLEKARQTIQSRQAVSSMKNRVHALESRIAADCYRAMMVSGNQQLAQSSLTLLGCSGKEEAMLLQGEPENLKKAEEDLRSMDLHVISSSDQDPSALVLIARPEFRQTDLESIKSLTEKYWLKSSDVLADWTGVKEVLQASSADSAPFSESQISLIKMDLLKLLARAVLEAAEKRDASLCCQKSVQEILMLLDEKMLDEQLVQPLEALINRLYGCQIRIEKISKSEESSETILLWYYRQVYTLLQKLTRSQSTVQYRQTLAWMEQNYRKQITLSDAAEEIHISAYHLSRLLNQQGEDNFSSLLNRIRIEQSKQMIRSGESFKVIAWKTGYSSQSYFSKNVRRLTGISPREYRNVYEWFIQQ